MLESLTRIRTGWLEWTREGDVWTAHGPSEFFPGSITVEKTERGWQVWGIGGDGCFDDLAYAFSDVESYATYRILYSVSIPDEDHDARHVAFIEVTGCLIAVPIP